MSNPLSTLSGKLTWWQKGFAYMLMGATVIMAMKIFNNYIAPNLIWFLKNIWAIVLLGTPLVFLTLYIITNPAVIWGVYKTLSVKITSFLVKMDPLSVMDRYIDWLEMKMTNLSQTIETLRGKKIKLDRRIESMEKERIEQLRLGEAAIKQNEERRASLYGSKAAALSNSINALKPLQNKVSLSLDKLVTIHDNWGYGLEKFKFEVQIKREEYESIKEVVKGLKNADDMINSNSEQAKLYGMGLKELEERATANMGFIEEFDRRSKDIILGLSIERQANEDQGLKELESYMKKSELLISPSVQLQPQQQKSTILKFKNQ